MPACQKQILMRLFDETYSSEGNDACSCCYVCIRRHSENGCIHCSELLSTFFTSRPQKLKKSVASDVKEALTDFFNDLGLKSLLVEGELEIPIVGFIKDFMRMCDEVQSERDIVELWHIDMHIASEVYQLFKEVVEGIIEDHFISENPPESCESDGGDTETTTSDEEDTESETETESSTDSD